MPNNIRIIRKTLRMKTHELADLLACSNTQIYALEKEMVPINEDWKLKLSDAFKCEKELIKKEKITHKDLENIKNNYFSKSVTHVVGDVIKKQTIDLKYYNNITDLANDNNKITQQYEKQQLESLTNILIKDSSAIKICRNKTETLLINTSMTTPSEEPGVFVVKNELEEGATTFIATVHIDVLTGKVMMCLQDGLQQILLSTCKIVGRVISKIVSV